MSWEGSDDWYGGIVGEKGHYYHQQVILPRLLLLLNLKNGSLLDVGCGNGVFARALPKSIEYLGIDASNGLIQEAKKLSPDKNFLVADASCIPTKQLFDCALFLLSLQNMKHGEIAVREASKKLKNGGKMAIVMNHPCFRIPRQSGWGVEEAAKLQHRKINAYMSPLEIPIVTHPGKPNSSQTTSYHYPLSTYSNWLEKSDLLIERIEEWCSDKKSVGAKAKMEDRARKEIPLFLTILAKKQSKE
jgi:ubiquinone/menaquinone biosynthesis C-methylase UbiE